jgi:hypothetical protein
VLRQARTLVLPLRLKTRQSRHSLDRWRQPVFAGCLPYVESAFRTLKYRPELPVKPFENLLAARRWVTELAHWYNHEHRHSAIGFVTPAQRHAGLDRTLLEERALVYERARQKNPQRWSKQARQWAHVDVVRLNPETPQIKGFETRKKQPDSLHFKRQLP